MIEPRAEEKKIRYVKLPAEEEVEINAAGWMLQVKPNLPLVGRRSSICMLMPVWQAWLVGWLVGW